MVMFFHSAATYVAGRATGHATGRATDPAPYPGCSVARTADAAVSSHTLVRALELTISSKNGAILGSGQGVARLLAFSAGLASHHPDVRVS